MYQRNDSVIYLSFSPSLCVRGMPSPFQHSPTYNSLLRAGPRLRPLKQVHAQMIISGLHTSRSLLTKLLTLLSQVGPTAAAYAAAVLAAVVAPDAFLFNSLIRVSSRCGAPLAALNLYRRMRAAGLRRCSFTFTAAAKACGDLAAHKTGRELHGHLLIEGFCGDVYSQTALIALYGKCGDLATARKIFDEMPNRSLVAWNAMISGYEQNGMAGEAIRVFKDFQNHGGELGADAATMVSVLSACAQLGDLAEGELASQFVLEKGIPLGDVLGAAMVSMYARCGSLGSARRVFDELPSPNVVAWTAMISGYSMHGNGAAAVELFREMGLRGPPPNAVTFVAVLSACAHAGLVDEGKEVFRTMGRDYGLVPREEHVVCMVDMLGRAGLIDEASWFVRHHGPIGPAALTALLGACRMHRRIDLGTTVAEQLIAMEPMNPGHYVLLSNLYAQGGRMKDVERVRDEMTTRGLRKLAGYSSVEVGGATHVFCMGDRGHPKAVEIYRFLEELVVRMRGIGYSSETGEVMHELEEEEREEVALRLHSEKLAVVFGIMSAKEGEPVRVIKNLRICGDCHSAFKFMSVVAEREIIIRDKYRFHHFKDGSCSCRDFW